MNFIDMFLEFTKDGESPTSFFRWSAISILSAVMRDNVYYDAAMDKIYPNIYVLLVAKSGACRKGTPLKVAQRFVSMLGNTKVISGRTSIQGAMQVLGGFDSKHNLKGASGLLYTEELSAFIVDDPAAIKILTDWYDYHEKWTNTLVTGISELHNVCVSILGASNEHLLKDVYNDKAIYGGLLARTFIILEEKRRKKNSRMYVDPKAYDPEKLMHHLKALSKIKGPVEFSEEAKLEYDRWYNSIDDESYKSRSGVIERIHTGVLKLAIILAASEDLIISMGKIHVTKFHVDTAIEMCWNLLKNYEVLTMGSGKSPIGHQIALFVKELRSATEFTMSRKQVIQRLWADIDAATLDSIVTTLEQAGMLETILSNNTNSYRLTMKCIEVIENSSVEVQSNGTGSKPKAAKFVN